jgi:regulator of sigma E protease
MMESLAVFGGFGASVAGYIVPFLIVLTIVVFFHELGHFLVARWCGVAVKAFSVGFGPEIFGFTDRRGTRWKLSAIPLGGYVKFLGDMTEAGGTDRSALDGLSSDERKEAFVSKSVAARAAIVAAGPIANFVLAVAIFTAIYSVYGRQVTEARVDAIVVGSPAERAGFQQGDIVRAIDGVEIGNFADLQRIVGISADTELQVTVERGGSLVTLLATPERQEIEDRFGNKQRIGMLGISRATTAENVITERYSVPQAAVLAVQDTWFVVHRTMAFLGDLVVGRESTDQLGGPIKIAQISGQVAELGFLPLINLAAFLSISIGLINLFPIPILDGGHLAFYLIEAVRGRPLPEHIQEMSFRVGFAALMLLMLFTVWQDTQSWWG